MPSLARPAPAVTAAPTASVVRAVHLGMGWFPEQAGGLNRMYYNLLQYLPEAGVEGPGLVAGAPDWRKRTRGRVHTFASSAASMPQRLWAARSVGLDLLEDVQPDLLVSHFALYTAPLGGALTAQPFVVHFHGPWADEGAVEGQRLAARAKAWLESYVYRRAQRLIVLSEAFRDVLHRRYGIPLERIDLVPGGVDVDHFDTAYTPRLAAERLGWPTDRPVLFVVRRLVPRMGLELLIDAVDQVRRAVPDVLLLIAGKGPLADTLQQRIDARGLGDHVRLLGFVPDEDLPLAYRAATLTVMPTVALEGFGLPTIESLAAGTPVLVTPVGGLPETIRGFADHLILPEATEAALADHLMRLLHGDLALPEAAACQAFARERYAWPVIAAQTAAVYHRALATAS